MSCPARAPVSHRQVLQPRISKSVLIPKRPRHYLLGCSKACRLLSSVGFDLQKLNLSLNGIFFCVPSQFNARGDSNTDIKLRRDTGGRFVFVSCVGPLSHLGERPARTTTKRRRDEQRLHFRKQLGYSQLL